MRPPQLFMRLDTQSEHWERDYVKCLAVIGTTCAVVSRPIAPHSRFHPRQAAPSLEPFRTRVCRAQLGKIFVPVNYGATPEVSPMDPNQIVN